MSGNNSNRSQTTIVAILLASFVPFLWRAVEYYHLGAYVPAYFVVGATGLMAVSCLVSARGAVLALKAWCAFLIGYGVIRIALGLAAWLDLIPSAHARDAVSPGFVVLSIAFIGAGILLFNPMKGGASD